jgi:hypothetical protein
MIAACASGAALAPASARAATPKPLRVVAVYPLRRGLVAGDAAFTVRFSQPLAASPLVTPTLLPRLAGRWRRVGPRTLRFVAASAYEPGTRVTLTVPAGVLAAAGGRLTRAAREHYVVRAPSMLRLVQLLATLGYLPVHFVSAHKPPAGDRRAQMSALFSPPPGRLAVGHGWPASLRSLWNGQRALVIRGAVMNFQSQHGLAMTGVLAPALWRPLIAAVLHHQFNRTGYTYAVASEATPETLTLYHNGVVVLDTLANTGISVSPTALGTYPVYERLRSQVMQGVNPDGVPYADPVQFVSYFNGGDAVHYMPRASYGYPQSLGCVELPYAAAARAWGYITYGTLVTVL